MKRKRKNVILSLILSFCLCFSVAVSFPQAKTAKALDSSTYSIYNYEWANYFDISAVELSTSTGYSFSKNDDEGTILTSVKSSSVDTQPYSIRLNLETVNTFSACCVPNLLNGEDYRFSCVITSSRADFGYSDVAFQIGLNTVSFDPTVFDCPLYVTSLLTLPDNTNAQMRFQLSVNCFVSDFSWASGDTITISQIMLTHGTDVYDYTPYFYSLETLPDDSGSGDSSSDDSSGSGDEETPSGDYEQGYLDGLAQARYGIFNGAVLETRFLMSDGSVAVPSSDYPLRLLLFDGGLIFTPLAEWIEDSGMAGASLKGVRISVHFSSNIAPLDLKLRAQGPTGAFASAPSVLYSNAGTSSAEFVYDSDTYYYDYTILSPLQTSVSSLFSWDIINYENLVGLTLYDSKSDYMSGYGDGFDDGRTEGLKIGGASGYNEGYTDGHRIGYDNGYALGVQQDNSFYDLLFAAVDVPVQAFLGLFSFEVLGVNMQELALSLLSLLLLVTIIRWLI